MKSKKPKKEKTMLKETRALLVQIPADLMTRLKVTAVMENIALKDLVAEALESHLKTRKSKSIS